MSSTLDILNEIHKGLVMGMESISVISDKVGDGNFKDDLDYQYKEYGKVLDRVNNMFKEKDEYADDTNTIEKVMGWTSIQFSTITDKSNSHLSEMLIRGNTMGIIQGVKLLNQNPDATNDVKNIINEFVQLQENNVEKLKTYL